MLLNVLCILKHEYYVAKINIWIIISITSIFEFLFLSLIVINQSKYKLFSFYYIIVLSCKVIVF